jgi:probable HAF family extracellular repeat protein
MRNVQTVFVAILASLALHDAPSAAPARTIYDLGGILGRANLAMDVNDRGDVVGVGAFQSEVLAETRALLWSRGTLVTLPPLPGDVASMAGSINNRGQVVGHSIAAPFVASPVLWDRGTVVKLEALPNQVTGQAMDINDHGEIAGTVTLYDAWTGQQRAVVWRKGKAIDIFPPSVTWSSALAINNRGQVVGQAFGSMMVRERNISRSVELNGAYIWDRGKVTLLGTLGGVNTIAFDINDRGQITGMSDNEVGEYHTFLWVRGRMRDLGTLTEGHSTGLGLNNKAEVVGQADPGVAFVWRQGRIRSLGFFESDFSRAESINGRGVVVGVGVDSAGENHAVMWVEASRPISPRWINIGGYQ